MPHSQRDADTEPAPKWVRILELPRLNVPPQGTFVAAGGRELAVFRLPEPRGWVVIDNACPHAGGNLSGGTLDGQVVECPWHQWRFDLGRGDCVHAPSVRVRRYPTRVEDDVLYARLEDSPAPCDLSLD